MASFDKCEKLLEEVNDTEASEYFKKQAINRDPDELTIEKTKDTNQIDYTDKYNAKLQELKEKGELSNEEYDLAKFEIMEKMDNISNLDKLFILKEKGELSNEEYLILKQRILRKITGKKE